MNWQQISTAPRDGTNILVRFGQDGTSQAKFIAGLPHPWQFIDTQNGISWLINHAKDGPGGPSHWTHFPEYAAPLPQQVAGSDLPPLPNGDFGTILSRHEGEQQRYSADQMHAYARLARTAAPSEGQAIPTWRERMATAYLSKNWANPDPIAYADLEIVDLRAALAKERS